MTEYSVLPLRVTGKADFFEATAEELRVLLSLIELSGRVESNEALASLSGTSVARCSAAIRFWAETGVISERKDQAPTVTEEFEERILSGEIIERTSKEVAKTIRDNALSDMINECAGLMGKSNLPTSDVKRLAALYEQYKLSADYIVTLAA